MLFHPRAGETRHRVRHLLLQSQVERDPDWLCVCGGREVSQCLPSEDLVCKLNTAIFIKLTQCNLCVYNVLATLWKLVDSKEKCGPVANWSELDFKLCHPHHSPSGFWEGWVCLCFSFLPVQWAECIFILRRINSFTLVRHLCARGIGAATQTAQMCAHKWQQS